MCHAESQWTRMMDVYVTKKKDDVCNNFAMHDGRQDE
jgi:hypothetical protein